MYLEKIILKHFKWKLTVPTALHFAQYFMEFAIVGEDVCQNCSNHSYVYDIIRKTVNELLDLILEGKGVRHRMKLKMIEIAGILVIGIKKWFYLKIPFSKLS